MKKIQLLAVFVWLLAFAPNVLAADQSFWEFSNGTEQLEKHLRDSSDIDIALIEAYDGQPLGAAHAFCLALTSEQIGFAIDTLEALGTAGMLVEGQANVLVSKLQVAQSQLDTKHIVEVFRQVEDFIRKINLHTKKGKVTPDNGLLLINSTLSVMCRT